jgi:hypothetical protein
MSKTISGLVSLPTAAVESVDENARMNKLAHAAFAREVLRKVTDVILPLNDSGTGSAFYCVHPITGAATNFCPMAKMLGPKQRFYGIQTLTKKRNEPPRDCRRLVGLSYAAMAGCSSMA